MTVKRTTALTVSGLVALTLAGGLTLAACGTDEDPGGTALPSTGASPATTPSAPVVQETTPAPVPTEVVVADEWSQVIDGVLFQGTQAAPVRIGTDTPGQPPAAEATVPQLGTDPNQPSALPDLLSAARDADKYVVLVTPRLSDDFTQFLGFRVLIYQENQWENMKAKVTFGTDDPFPTVDEALAQPRIVDGRELDRAEYVLVINTVDRTVD